MEKLIPGSSHTLTIDPQLAAWVGLNESILVQQLHYVLSNKEDDLRYLKTIDGQRWYRESPKDFVAHHFPFWDESVVKRTLANLRKDGLILARSDLNKDPKDRSLWYSIDYAALEYLTGPVDRLLKKQAKRRKARLARTENEAKQGDDRDSDYTKVQNVLLMSKVQNVPDSKSTKRTDASVQNEPLTQVQNVPTPKEVIPKEGIKDIISAPAQTKKSYSPKQKLMFALADACRIDIKLATDKTWGQLSQAANKLQKAGHVPGDVDQFKNWWFANDWRGQDDQPPTPPQVLEAWGNYQHWRKNEKQKGSNNGKATNLSGEQLERYRELERSRQENTPPT